MEEVNEKACVHCNEVMCSVCENKTCDDTHLNTLKCREWRDRRAGYYCGFQDGFKEGCNKANEWHYCKDELPSHNGQFYVALKGDTETFILRYDYGEYDDGKEVIAKMTWLDDDDTYFDDEVYAWREKLKAPKEVE